MVLPGFELPHGNFDTSLERAILVRGPLTPDQLAVQVEGTLNQRAIICAKLNIGTN